jgi:hypothetical protein
MTIGALIANAVRKVAAPEATQLVARPVEAAAKAEVDRVVVSAQARRALTAARTLDQAAVRGLDAQLAPLAELTPAAKQALTAFHAPVYADPAAQARAGKALGGWVFGGQGKVDMIQAFKKVGVEGRAPASELEQAVAELAGTRKARWERLAAQTGVAAPEAFHLYRGVNGDYAVEAVVRAWADPSAKAMTVPTHELASWSLDRGIAEAFGDSRTASVIYEADVPFAKTLADKWVDGGPFVRLGLEQQEVVVAGAKDAVALPVARAKVVFRGKTYTYADREALVDAWRRAFPG